MHRVDLKWIIKRGSSLVVKGINSFLKEGVGATWYKVRCIAKSFCIYEKYYQKEIVLSSAEQKKQKNKAFEKDVLFSVIVPLYNTPEKYLREMIESVQGQTYSGWELCLADGSDDACKEVGEICSEYGKKDSRIKYKKLEKNMGISENTNAAIAMATGDYIGLFDHDDILHPSALYEYMEVICSKNADFIYCDEMIFADNLRHIITIHFKPDYALDNLRANNYICHFSVFKKELLREVGKVRKEFEGAQDHDLVFRLTEKATTIVHVPKVLYFWRSHPGSVAADVSCKSYAVEAGKRAVKEHLIRCGENGTIESSRAYPTHYRIKYDIRRRDKVSIIIPNHNHKEDLSRCIESIQKLTSYDDYEIIIVENNSNEDNIFEYYKELEACDIISVIKWDKPFKFSAINNYAATLAKGRYLLFLNNDTEVMEPMWLEELIMYAQRNDVGAVGAKLYYPDDTIQHAGIVLGLGSDSVAGPGHYKVPRSNLGYMGRLAYAQNVCAVTAACMMVRKEVFLEVNGFDEDFEAAFNDVDLCMKIRKAGYVNVFTPYAELYHFESKTRGWENTREKKNRLQKETSRFKTKWAEELEMGDPYFNQNFHWIERIIGSD